MNYPQYQAARRLFCGPNGFGHDAMVPVEPALGPLVEEGDWHELSAAELRGMQDAGVCVVGKDIGLCLRCDDVWIDMKLRRGLPASLVRDVLSHFCNVGCDSPLCSGIPLAPPIAQLVDSDISYHDAWCAMEDAFYAAWDAHRERRGDTLVDDAEGYLPTGWRFLAVWEAFTLRWHEHLHDHLNRLTTFHLDQPPSLSRHPAGSVMLWKELASYRAFCLDVIEEVVRNIPQYQTNIEDFIQLAAD